MARDHAPSLVSHVATFDTEEAMRKQGQRCNERWAASQRWQAARGGGHVEASDSSACGCLQGSLVGAAP